MFLNTTPTVDVTAPMDTTKFTNNNILYDGFTLSGGVLSKTSSPGLTAYAGSYIGSSGTHVDPIVFSATMSVTVGSGMMLYGSSFSPDVSNYGLRFEIKRNSDNVLMYTFGWKSSSATKKNGMYSDVVAPHAEGTTRRFTIATTPNGYHLVDAMSSTILCSLVSDPLQAWNSIDSLFNGGGAASAGSTLFSVFARTTGATVSTISMTEQTCLGSVFPTTARNVYTDQRHQAYIEYDATVDALTTQGTQVLGTNASTQFNKWGSSYSLPVKPLTNNYGADMYYPNGATIYTIWSASANSSYDGSNISSGFQSYLFKYTPAVINGGMFTLRSGGGSMKMRFNQLFEGNYYPFQVEVPGTLDTKTGITSPSTYYNCPAGYVGPQKYFKLGVPVKIEWRPTVVQYETSAFNGGKWYLTYTPHDGEQTIIDLSFIFQSVHSVTIPAIAGYVELVAEQNVVFSKLFSGYAPTSLGFPRRPLNTVGYPYTGNDVWQRSGVVYTGKDNNGRSEAA